MNNTGILIEGNLIALELAADVSQGEVKGQSAVDFGFKNNDRLEDEIALAWGLTKAYWDVFQKRFQMLDPRDTATSLTREAWALPLLQSLGYQPDYLARARVVDGQTYAISHQVEAGEDKCPLHIVGCRLDLERRPPAGTPRLSPHALMQEYLNCTEHLWGIVTNGLQWRLLRDCSLMTRLVYVEFDLEQILNGENYAEFKVFYRLFHRSRLPGGVDDVDECLLEFYYQETLQQGGRVRDKLRDGVEEALKLLGNGFLQHPRSEELRGSFVAEGGTGRGERDFYRVLLLLVYRLLFLMVAESRNLLLVGDDVEMGRIYREYYSVERLRALAERPSHRREGFQDLWQGLRATFALFDENWRGKLLGLSPLNGDLFGSGGLGVLDGAAIDNRDLLLAVRNLSLYEHKGRLQRVNYGALDVEELGSVYESLLELSPQVTRRTGILPVTEELGSVDESLSEFAPQVPRRTGILPVTEVAFDFISGTERKTTGSYYTPRELVAQLVKTALEPVVEERLRGLSGVEEKQRALLSLKVCDPACGSGHFLLAAVRCLGKELAKVQTGEAQPGAAALREAKREVLQHCIYGVDLNPLAVDLCKVALWIEGLSLGMPLSFLDHRIRWGNSLVGVLDLACLDDGIPDDAFKPVTGDDKSVAADFKKRNKQERKDKEAGQLLLEFSEEGLLEERREYVLQGRELEGLPERTTEDVKRKGARYYRERSANNKEWWRDFSACNLWTAAFFMPLTEQQLELMPTSAALHRLLAGELMTRQVVDAANGLARKKGFFHWPLEFPEVFAGGGFDCVLGNPPWERIKLQEKEFFASRDEGIAKAKNKAARTKLIKGLAQKNPLLLREFEEAKHDAEAQSKFFETSSRFPLTAVGDINTCSVFAETARMLISPSGRAGLVVQASLATGYTTRLFIQDLVDSKSLESLYDFTNRGYIFKQVESTFSFALMTVSHKNSSKASLASQLWSLSHLREATRIYSLSDAEIKKISPNTQNLPIFLSSLDCKLVLKIAESVPAFINKADAKNYWNITFERMFDMSNDSEAFKTRKQLMAEACKLNKNIFEGEKNRYLPLYESKLAGIYNHRASTFEGVDESKMFGTKPKTNQLTLEKLTNIDETILPRYWVEEKEVNARIPDFWKHQWLLGFRNALSAVADSRSVRFAIIPRYGVGNSMPLILTDKPVKQICCLLANFNSLILDYVAKQKASGGNLNYYILKQLPIIPPEAYTQEDIDYISSRVLELVYTANDMTPFARDMGYDGEPFLWDEQRRAKLRAELDAKYAKLYGLTREELRYILDPTEIYGADFPSETFRVLKNKEVQQYGEYLTQKLVLAAWDAIGN